MLAVFQKASRETSLHQRPWASRHSGWLKRARETCSSSCSNTTSRGDGVVLETGRQQHSKSPNPRIPACRYSARGNNGLPKQPWEADQSYSCSVFENRQDEFASTHIAHYLDEEKSRMNQGKSSVPQPVSTASVEAWRERNASSIFPGFASQGGTAVPYVATPPRMRKSDNRSRRKVPLGLYYALGQWPGGHFESLTKARLLKSRLYCAENSSVSFAASFA